MYSCTSSLWQLLVLLQCLCEAFAAEADRGDMAEQGLGVQALRELPQELPHVLQGVELQEVGLVEMQDACGWDGCEVIV